LRVVADIMGCHIASVKIERYEIKSLSRLPVEIILG
jgi:hypothetical protein